MLDCHRLDPKLAFGESDDPTTSLGYSVSDFPTADELRQHGIQKVVYLSKGDQAGQILPDYQSVRRLSSDLVEPVTNWSEAGIQILYTGIAPEQPDQYDYDAVQESRPAYPEKTRVLGLGKRIFDIAQTNPIGDDD